MLYTQTGTPYYASPEAPLLRQESSLRSTLQGGEADGFPKSVGEVWKDCPYDEKSDIWGLGCVVRSCRETTRPHQEGSPPPCQCCSEVYEMCALRPPFRAEDMEGLYRKARSSRPAARCQRCGEVLRGNYPRIPSCYSNDLHQVPAEKATGFPRRCRHS